MATLVRLDPFREVAALQNEMGRMLGMFREGNGTSERSWVPALDVWETDDAYVYAFDLPGIPEEQISVEFEDGLELGAREVGHAGEVAAFQVVSHGTGDAKSDYLTIRRLGFILPIESILVQKE